MQNSTLSISTPNVAKLALGALLIGAAAIGVAPVFVRLSETGPMATGFWRLLLAVPVFWLWSNLDKKEPAAPGQYSGVPLILLVAAGLFYACDLATWHLSLKLTTIANATLLTNFAPIFVTLGGWLLWQERFKRSFYIGLALAVAGAIMLIGASFSLNRQHFMGDLLGLVSAMFYGCYLLTIKQLRSRFSTPVTMMWGGLVASTVLLIFAWVAGEQILAVSALGWLLLVALALISQVGGQGLIAFALAHLPAPFSSVTLLLQPVVATFFAWLVFDEVLAGWQALGAAIVLTGIWLARRGSR